MDPALIFALSMLAVDYGQTRSIQTQEVCIPELQGGRCVHPYEETNRLLGKHPGNGTINSYFAAVTAGTVALNLGLPKPYGTLSSVAIGIGELHTVRHNYSINLKWSF